MTVPITAAAADVQRAADVVLDVLWRSSWQASVLAAIVLLVQFALRKQLTARWRHALWGIVLLRLLIPVTPASPWSLFNVAPPVSGGNPQHPLGAITSTSPGASSLPLAVSPQVLSVTWKTVLAAFWLIGLAWMLARIAWASIFLSLSVRRMRRVEETKLLALLDRCRRELGVRRKLPILAAPNIGAPALMGFFKPRLLLPPAVMNDFGADELRHILLHELAHLKRHDVAINWLASVLQALHWFNPVIWLAMARLRNDRELAADELVLSLTAGDAPPRDAYGHTLVKLLQTLSTTRGPALSGTVGILERAQPMRRRITMIAQFDAKHAKRWTLAAGLCMLVLLGIGLTDAVRGKDAPEPPTSRPAGGEAPNDRDPALRAGLARMQKEGEQATTASSVPPIAGRSVDAYFAAERKPASQPATAAIAASAAADPDDEKAAAMLKKRLPEVRFDAIALSDVIDFLRDITGANIFVNWRALEAAGIDRNTPISMRLKDSTFEQVLKQLVRDAGGETIKVDFGISDGVIVVSTAEEMASHPQLQSFDVTDLLKPEDQGSAAALQQVLLAHVPGVTITAYHERLLVKGTTQQIGEVERVLNELRRKK